MKNYADQFAIDGYCIIPNAIDHDLVSRVNRDIDIFLKSNMDRLISNNLLVHGMLQRVVNLHYSINSLKDVFIEAMNNGNEIVDKYGDATLYTSLFFELGSEQPLHRDTPYFFSGGVGGYLGAWVALDNVDENNGALIAVKGSHNLPEPDLLKLKEAHFPDAKVPPSSTPLFNAYNEELVALSEQQNMQLITLKVNKGDMVIWNPSTLHGGMAHLDKTRSRRSFVMP